MGNLQEAVRRIIEDTCVDCGGTFEKFVCATSRVRCDNCRNAYRYRKYGIKIPTKTEQPKPAKQIKELHKIDNRIEKTCEVCKVNFKVKKNLASTARRCNKCQRTYVQQLQP